MKHGHTGQADRVGGNRQQEQKWNGWMTPEDQPGNDVAARNIDGTGRHPPALEHVLADIVEKREIARDRHDHAADGGGDGQRGTAPRVKGPARQRGLRHLLGDQRKEEDDADIVHGEGGGVRESIVAVREACWPRATRRRSRPAGRADSRGRNPRHDGDPPPSRQCRRLCDSSNTLLHASASPAGPGAEWSRNRPSRRCGRWPGMRAGSRRFPRA